MALKADFSVGRGGVVDPTSGAMRALSQVGNLYDNYLTQQDRKDRLALMQSEEDRKQADYDQKVKERDSLEAYMQGTAKPREERYQDVNQIMANDAGFNQAVQDMELKDTDTPEEAAAKMQKQELFGSQVTDLLNKSQETQLQQAQRVAGGMDYVSPKVMEMMRGTEAADVQARSDARKALEAQLAGVDAKRASLDEKMAAALTTKQGYAKGTTPSSKTTGGTSAKGFGGTVKVGDNAYDLDRYEGVGDYWKDQVSAGWDGKDVNAILGYAKDYNYPPAVVDKAMSRMLDSGWDNTLEAKNGMDKVTYAKMLMEQEKKNYNSYNNGTAGGTYLKEDTTATRKYLGGLDKQYAAEASGIRKKLSVLDPATQDKITGAKLTSLIEGDKPATKKTTAKTSRGNTPSRDSVFKGVTSNPLVKAYKDQSKTALGDAYVKNPEAFGDNLVKLYDAGKTEAADRIVKAIGNYKAGIFGETPKVTSKVEEPAPTTPKKDEVFDTLDEKVKASVEVRKAQETIDNPNATPEQVALAQKMYKNAYAGQAIKNNITHGIKGGMSESSKKQWQAIGDALSKGADLSGDAYMFLMSNIGNLSDGTKDVILKMFTPDKVNRLSPTNIPDTDPVAPPIR